MSMKIAIVCPASLPAVQFGGILFLGVDIAKDLSNEGHDVTIYTTDLDFANNPKTFNKNLPQLEKYENFKINRTHTWFSLFLFYVNPGMYYQLKNDKPDIIHTIGIRSFQSFIAALISKKYSIPLIISDQGGLSTHPELSQGNMLRRTLYKFQSPLVQFIINQSKKIIVANDYEKKIFSKFTTDSKIVIIRNGINLEELETHSIDFKKKYNIAEKIILFVGRFNKVKGIDILLRAFSLIKDRDEIKDVKLVIMGVDFGYELEMFKEIENLGIKNRVLVISKPPRVDVISAYRSCEFLVLPSRWELSPLTPLEGFYFKKPVISTNTHGIPYTISDKEDAILVEPENYFQLSEAIIQLLRDDEMRTRYGNAGFKLVKDECNSKKMSEKILAVYREVVG